MTRPRTQNASQFDKRHFKDALSQFATGVTIITTQAENGNFLGITASSFNSVSLDPPLVLWSLSNTASSLPVFTSSSHYVINVLGFDQAELAKQFSKSLKDRFAGVNYSLSRTGLPIIDGAVAWFLCHNRSRYLEGDHVILVGEVEQCEFVPGAPLIFHGGQLLSSDNK